MASVTIIDSDGRELETFSDPRDPQLCAKDFHFQEEVRSFLYEDKTTTIDLGGKERPLGEKWHCLQIPVTDNCNLECRHCPRPNKYVHKDYPLNTFAQFLSRFSPDKFESLLISDCGEPLIRKDIIEILRYAKTQGFNHTQLVTTGTLLREPLIKTIIDENLLQKILISVEASSKELYEYIRGADFDLMKSCVKRMTEYREETNSYYPVVYFNVTCMAKNIHELSGIMDLAHELGGDYVYFVHLNSVVAGSKRIRDRDDDLYYAENHLNTCDKDLIKKVFQEIQEKSKKHKIPFLPPEDYFPGNKPIVENASPKPKDGPRCTMPYQWVQVDAGGNVYPCCQIAHRYSVGNVNENSFEEIWDSTRFTEFREGLENGNPNKWCKTCNIYNGQRF